MALSRRLMGLAQLHVQLIGGGNIPAHKFLLGLVVNVRA